MCFLAYPSVAWTSCHRRRGLWAPIGSDRCVAVSTGPVPARAADCTRRRAAGRRWPRRTRSATSGDARMNRRSCRRSCVPAATGARAGCALVGARSIGRWCSGPARPRQQIQASLDPAKPRRLRRPSVLASSSGSCQSKDVAIGGLTVDGSCVLVGRRI